MNYLIVADVHTGNHQVFGGKTTAGINQRCRYVLDTINKVDALALQQKAKLVVAGDLFDKATPDPRIVAAVRDALDLQEPYGITGSYVRPLLPVIVAGNHDAVSSNKDDHCLNTLKPATIVGAGESRIEGSVIFVGYKPGVDGYTYMCDTLSQLAESLARMPQAPRLLVIHLGIEDEQTPPWLRGAQDSIKLDDLVKLCLNHGITHVAAGNWHERKEWVQSGVHVIQVGALVPTGFDNPGPTGYGTALIWDGQDFSYTELPGPRFIKVFNSTELDELVANRPAEASPLCLRWECQTKDQLALARHLIATQYSKLAPSVFVEATLENKRVQDELQATTIAPPTVEGVFRGHRPNATTEALRLLHESENFRTTNPVQVKRIRVKGAGLHKNSELELPDRGIVLLTGPNGAGKSTLVQAVPLCFWERPTGHRPDMWTSKSPEIQVTCYNGVTYTRRPNSKPTLTWTDGPSYDRKGDAQTAIEQEFGTLEQWTRHALLDGKDGGYLTTAGPSDRRRILTVMAALDGFDDAYQTAQQHVKQAEQQLNKVTSDLAVLQAKLEVLNVSRPDVEHDLPGVEAVLVARLKAEEAERARLSTELVRTRGLCKETRDRAVREKALYEAAKKRSEQLASDGVCPTCGQSVAVVTHDHSPVDDLDKQLEELKALIAQVKSAEASLAADEARLGKLNRAVQAATAELARVRHQTAQLAEWEQLEAKLDALRNDIQFGVRDQEAATRALDKAKDVAWLLSPNGPRGEMLTRFCEVLSSQATQLLTEAYGAEHWVKIEIANKGVELTSSLGPSPSRGQLRRLDVALSIAGLQISEAVAGHNQTTLWIDEAFEVLDPEGVAGSAKILEQVARKRCVVVVAHQAADQLRAASHAIYEVDNSEVTRVR